MAGKQNKSTSAGIVEPPVVTRGGSSTPSAVVSSMAEQISEENWVSPLDGNGNPIVYSDKSAKDPAARARRLAGNAVAGHKRPLVALLQKEGRITDPYQVKSKAWAIDDDGHEFVFALRLRTEEEMQDRNNNDATEETPEA